MTDVLAPVQNDISNTILTNKHLLDHDGEILNMLQDYLDMTSSYKIIISRWQMNEFSCHFSSKRFPPALIEQLEAAYIEAKFQQNSLLNLKAAKSSCSKGTDRADKIKLFQPDYVVVGRRKL